MIRSKRKRLSSPASIHSFSPSPTVSIDISLPVIDEVDDDDSSSGSSTNTSSDDGLTYNDGVVSDNSDDDDDATVSIHSSDSVDSASMVETDSYESSFIDDRDISDTENVIDTIVTESVYSLI